MKNSRIYCEECREEVDVYTIEKKMEGTIKGKKYMYMGKEAHCARCHTSLYVADIHDANLNALYTVYRRQHGIISLSTILAIPDKYAIGKRPLSLILGWGEQTFSRYCQGDLPTKQYSDILQKIYDDVAYYERILEQNRSLIKEAAYRKSRKAVDQMLHKSTPKKDKMEYAVAYIINQCNDLTPLALQKALYYMQGFYYAFHHTFLFQEDCEAWVHGPVYRHVYDQYHEGNSLRNLNIEGESKLSEREKEIMDSVIHYLCCYSGNVLEIFTHKEDPWRQTRADIPMDVGCSRKIDKARIGAYFQKVKETYAMQIPDDIRQYACSMFEQL